MSASLTRNPLQLGTHRAPSHTQYCGHLLMGFLVVVSQHDHFFGRRRQLINQIANNRDVFVFLLWFINWQARHLTDAAYPGILPRHIQGTISAYACHPCRKTGRLAQPWQLHQRLGIAFLCSIFRHMMVCQHAVGNGHHGRIKRLTQSAVALQISGYRGLGQLYLSIIYL